MFDLGTLKCAKPFDIRRERKHWWKILRHAGPVPKEQIIRGCPRTIKKFERLNGWN